MAPHHEYDHVNRKLRHLLHCALYRRTVVARCPVCRREGRYDGVALWWLFHRKGWDDRLAEVPRRLRCRSCFDDRRKIVRPTIRLNRDEPDKPLPYPPEREWKKIVSRYRS